MQKIIILLLKVLKQSIINSFITSTINLIIFWLQVKLLIISSADYDLIGTELNKHLMFGEFVFADVLFFIKLSQGNISS
jgi:hypothetical protein